LNVWKHGDYMICIMHQVHVTWQQSKGGQKAQTESELHKLPNQVLSFPNLLK